MALDRSTVHWMCKSSSLFQPAQSPGCKCTERMLQEWFQQRILDRSRDQTADHSWQLYIHEIIIISLCIVRGYWHTIASGRNSSPKSRLLTSTSGVPLDLVSQIAIIGSRTSRSLTSCHDNTIFWILQCSTSYFAFNGERKVETKLCRTMRSGMMAIDLRSHVGSLLDHSPFAWQVRVAKPWRKKPVSQE